MGWVDNRRILGGEPISTLALTLPPLLVWSFVLRLALCVDDAMRVMDHGALLSALLRMHVSSMSVCAGTCHFISFTSPTRCRRSF